MIVIVILYAPCIQLFCLPASQGAIALSRSLQSLLFETPPYDPLVLGAVALVLIASGLLACLVPATRAAKADIARLLRAE